MLLKNFIPKEVFLLLQQDGFREFHGAAEELRGDKEVVGFRNDGDAKYAVKELRDKEVVLCS